MTKNSITIKEITVVRLLTLKIARKSENNNQ